MGTSDTTLKEKRDCMLWIIDETRGTTLCWHLWTFNVQCIDVRGRDSLGIKLLCKVQTIQMQFMV